MVHAHRARELQAVIGSGLVRHEESHCAESRIGPARQDVGAAAGRGRSNHRIVDVAIKRQVVTQCSNVSCRSRQVLGQLALDGKVQLIRVGPLEVGVDRKDPAAGGERAFIGKRIAAEQRVVRIFQSSAQRHACGRGLLVDVSKRQSR